jgi:hypothetical protein
MVGTRLALFVVSDVPVDFWSGGLWISWDDWDRGMIQGRDFNEPAFSYEGSILPAAGVDPYAQAAPDQFGMDVTLDVARALAGEWFVLDYYAVAPGTCNVGLHADDAGASLDPTKYGQPPPAGQIWVQGLSFNHVPSQDYSGDSKVDFVDFSLWAARWKERALPDPNEAAPPDPNDPDANGPIEPIALDARDLALFCAYWLEQTDVNNPASDPNLPDTPL